MLRVALWVSLALLLVGMAMIVAFPMLVGDPTEAAEVGGVWPEWLVPAGYWIAAVGVTGATLAWIVRRARHPRRR